mgnify:CR=1 FL=1
MVAAALRQTTPGDVVNIDYWPIGGARDLWYAKERQVLIEGPAGTGKTIACLQKLHRQMSKYAGARALMVRKTGVSLTASALVTYQRKVLHPLDGVRFYGGSKAEPAKFIYPNGSEIVVGGMDNASKVLSTEYDVIYFNEATEATEDDIETLDTRLRNNVMPYQQIIMDCNPGPQSHWLNVRCDAGKTRRILSRHEDNPAYFDPRTKEWTDEGRVYIAGLDNLSGVRYKRLRLGLWVAAEGQIYETWDRNVHLIDRFPIPRDWPRYHACDFGFVNPFVYQWWAIDPDGNAYLYREIYKTQTLVEDHAPVILKHTANEPRPLAIITDHDAEDRATLERHLRMRTTAAIKDVSPGIQAVQSRLKVQGNGKPRLFVMRDSVVETDAELKRAGKPICTADEYESYVWDTRPGLRKGEQPVKENDHGMDTTRYFVMHLEPRKSNRIRGIR